VLAALSAAFELAPTKDDALGSLAPVPVGKRTSPLTDTDTLALDEDQASVGARSTLVPLLHPWKAVAGR
jgi:hypothetical protein